MEPTLPLWLLCKGPTCPSQRSWGGVLRHLPSRREIPTLQVGDRTLWEEVCFLQVPH